MDPGGQGDGRSRSANDSCGTKARPLASSVFWDRASMITILFNLAIWAVNVYKWVVIIAAILSTLSSFGVLDSRNRIVWTITDFLYRITEPALRPIRSVMPNFGGVDLSPLILIILLIVIEEVLARMEQALIFGTLRPLLL
jgi:YggT family protein